MPTVLRKYGNMGRSESQGVTAMARNETPAADAERERSSKRTQTAPRPGNQDLLPGAGSAGEEQSVRSLDRAFAALRLISGAKDDWSLSEIAAALNLPLTTCHRIIRVLQRHEMVVRDPESKRYRLGTAAMELGTRARRQISLASIALPALQLLVQETQETALLTIPVGLYSLCIQRVVSPHSLRLILEPGYRAPLHAGAMQKALLAFLPEEVIDAVTAGPLAAFSPTSITDAAQLRREIETIRERGFALSTAEVNSGTWGVAVPIIGPDGYAIAAVGSAGPLSRFSESVAREHSESCRRASAAILYAIEESGWVPALQQAGSPLIIADLPEHVDTDSPAARTD